MVHIHSSLYIQNSGNASGCFVRRSMFIIIIIISGITSVFQCISTGWTVPIEHSKCGSLRSECFMAGALPDANPKPTLELMSVFVLYCSVLSEIYRSWFYLHIWWYILATVLNTMKARDMPTLYLKLVSLRSRSARLIQLLWKMAKLV